MLVIGLTVAVIAVVATMFVMKTPLFMRIIAMFLLVFTLVIVIALTNSSVQKWYTPIVVDGSDVYMYDDNGRQVEFKVKDVSRVVTTLGSEKGIDVEVVVRGDVYSFNTSKISYEWSLRNQLHKHFQHVLHDATF